MNVYDFDKTIYDGDSTLDFYLYCIKKKPSLLFLLPKQFAAFLKYKVGRIDKTMFKQSFYLFLTKIDNIDTVLSSFWDKNENKIKEFYLLNHKNDDIIISASPYFLLEEIGKRLKISHLIASEVNKKTGIYTGKNCYGEEKVKRLEEYLKRQDFSIDCFYSDSYSDSPLARLANKAFLVKGNQLTKWK